MKINAWDENPMGAIWSEVEKGIRKVKTIQPLPNCLSKVSLIFLEINSKYKFPKALASSLIESCNNNIYFAHHLPRLTEIDKSLGKKKMHNQLFNLLYDMVMANLKYKSTNKIL